MAPAASRLRVESELGSLPKRALAQYLLFLKFYPVVTKAVSSGILSALGNLLAQMIEKKQKKDSRSLEVSGLLRYLVYGLFVTGPLSHYLYLFMEYWVPPEVPWARVKRLLLDRLFFAPTFLLLFFFVMNLLEGKNISVFVAKMRSGFWPALQMNWRMWTPLQFININYVPLQFRVLFANMAALFWYAYLASLGK
ncbi:peroxisomal membrane protein 2, isoform CRA_b [Rattus norvegicus]|uniref:Peroxisomal membrane protein 2, isoform CRA_b n=1 Tax=Rattus norvegicus TaxID=10116 RepID=A6J2B7_RAT|nr:peroxisomal membrane protein 2 [Rattus norvegicus]XP_032742820.1 peroxisomal membrane protein 2 [Rattus rattus]EDM14056.1 peroxisomal membrane protein 2, isoform CRA_b [Rattus norvegicus]